MLVHAPVVTDDVVTVMLVDNVIQEMAVTRAIVYDFAAAAQEPVIAAVVVT